MKLVYTDKMREIRLLQKQNVNLTDLIVTLPLGEYRSSLQARNHKIVDRIMYLQKLVRTKLEGNDDDA